MIETHLLCIRHLTCGRYGISILRMRYLKQMEVKALAQDHTVSDEVWNPNR